MAAYNKELRDSQGSKIVVREHLRVRGVLVLDWAESTPESIGFYMNRERTAALAAALLDYWKDK